jgi:hypothetical protein
MHSIVFELPVSGLRKTASSVCGSQMRMVNASNAPNEKMKLDDDGEPKKPGVAEGMVEYFLADCEKHLKIMKRKMIAKNPDAVRIIMRG